MREFFRKNLKKRVLIKLIIKPSRPMVHQFMIVEMVRKFLEFDVKLIRNTE